MVGGKRGANAAGQAGDAAALHFAGGYAGSVKNVLAEEVGAAVCLDGRDAFLCRIDV